MNNDINFSEYCGKVETGFKPGCKLCPPQAIIPTLSVETVEELKGLANCLVFVSSINTTYYIDDKHRITITWAGPVFEDNYDYETNPLNLRGQIVYDKANSIAIVYDNNGDYYVMALAPSTDFNELANRPKYNGELMTGETDIPEVKTDEWDAKVDATELADYLPLTGGTIIGELKINNDTNKLSQTTISGVETTKLISGAANANHSKLTISNDTVDGSNTIATLSAKGGNQETTLTISGSGATLDNVLDMSNNKISGISTPTANTDASNKKYVDDTTSSAVGTLSSDVTTRINNAVDPINSALNTSITTNVSVDDLLSTSTIVLDIDKKNLSTGSTSQINVALPVANASTAGVLNAPIYNTIQNNASNIDAILNGSVSIGGIAASPTQASLTTAWQNATGISTVINGAKINDSDNQKVWTYYTNTSTWYAATNTAQVTVNAWTNTSAGIVKGSVEDGQIYAETDGTGSVNGWDEVKSKLATIATGAEVNVQSDWSQTNTSSDDYIKNKPTLATVATSGSYNDLSNKPTLATVATTGSYNDLSNKPSFATVATSGSYNDLSNKPTIPTVNNATLTIQKNGTTVETFTANASSNVTANITVPNITMTTTDPGEGSPLAAGEFIAVYEA